MNNLEKMFRKVLFFLILINPLLSLVLDRTNIYYYYILGPLISILLILILLKDKILHKQCIMAVYIFLMCIIYGILTSISLGKINNHMFNYFNTILLFIYCINDDNIQSFKLFMLKNIKLIKFLVIFINLVEAYYIFTRNGYEFSYSWRGTFFRGTSSIPHILSYLMLVVIIISICVMILENKKSFALWAIIPLYAIFESGARVTLLASSVFVLMLIDIIFSSKKTRPVFKFLKAFIIMIILVYIFRDKIIASDVWNKIIVRQKSENFSAGRTYMWKDLLHHYIYDSNIIQYFLGQGDDKTYYYNSINPYVAVSAWAHNDFVQILVGKGLLGLYLYINTGFKFILKLFDKNGNYYTLYIVFFILLLSVLNGFYSYKDISLAIPFIAILNEYLFIGKSKNKSNN